MPSAQARAAYSERVAGNVWWRLTITGLLTVFGLSLLWSGIQSWAPLLMVIAAVMAGSSAWMFATTLFELIRRRGRPGPQAPVSGAESDG